MPFVHLMPPCPRCGCTLTHRIIAYNGLHESRILAEYMKTGEYVKPVSYQGKANCYCPDCGAEWTGEIRYCHVSGTELKELKERLGITKSDISSAENHEVHVRNEGRSKKVREHKILKGIAKFTALSTKNIIYYSFIEPFKAAFDLLDRTPTYKDDNADENGNKNIEGTEQE